LRRNILLVIGIFKARIKPENSISKARYQVFSNFTPNISDSYAILPELFGFLTLGVFSDDEFRQGFGEFCYHFDTRHLKKSQFSLFTYEIFIHLTHKKSPTS